MNGLTGQRGAATGGFCRRLPEVSASERDFWRRAVAEERERLDLAEGAAERQERRDTN
jgi:hypothetical protein